MSQSALYRLSEQARLDQEEPAAKVLVDVGDRKAIGAKRKRSFGTPGPLLSKTSKFVVK